MIVLSKEVKLRRPCRYCGEMFVPSTKYHRVCTPCARKSWILGKRRSLREKERNKLKQQNI